MIDPMGIFRTTIEIASLHDAEARRTLEDVMVDTGSEYNWGPAALLRELGVKPVRTDRFETAGAQRHSLAVGGAPATELCSLASYSPSGYGEKERV
jgi:hypothetical protein